MLRELLDRVHARDRRGVEPAAIVDLVSDRRGQVREELGGSPVEDSLVHEGERRTEQLHARSFVHACTGSGEGRLPLEQERCTEASLRGGWVAQRDGSAARARGTLHLGSSFR